MCAFFSSPAHFKAKLIMDYIRLLLVFSWPFLIYQFQPNSLGGEVNHGLDLRSVVAIALLALLARCVWGFAL